MTKKKKYRIHKPKLTPMQIARQRVLAGASYLNVVFPGWFKKIDLDELRLSDAKQCVIGQLYDNYRNSGDRIGIAKDFNIRIHGNGALSQTTAFGFAVSDTAIDYTHLDRAWKEKIRALRRSA